MKKVFISVLIVTFALCFSLPSIASVPPYTPDPYRPEGIVEYYRFLQTQNVPENFVYYEDISFLGSFVRLELKQKNNFDAGYTYTLKTYRNEEGGEDELYATLPTTFKVSFFHQGSAPEILISKDQILESEDLTVYYSGQSENDPLEDFGLHYGDFNTVKPRLEMIYQKPKNAEISMSFSPTSWDTLFYYLAEWNGTSVVYSPSGEFYHQMYFDDHREDMVRTVASVLHRRDYKRQYKEVFNSYYEFTNGLSKGLDFSAFSYVGTLKTYQLNEVSNFETGEFRLATPDPEIDIILTVKDWDPSENANEPSVTTEIPTGPDLRGQTFCRKYTDGEVVFGENEIVVKNSRYKKIMTLKTSPESALSNYPMYYDGGGFLSLLLSAEKNEYCSEYLFSSLAMAVAENLYYESSKPSSGTTNSASTNTDSTTDLSIDEGTGEVTDTANAEDATGTAGNSATTDPTPSTDGTDSPAVSTDTLLPTSSDPATPAEPTPFPWLWVIVPAGVIIFGGALAAVFLIRRKRKQS